MNARSPQIRKGPKRVSDSRVLTPMEERGDATLHLLSTRANAERIRRGLLDYQAGRLISGEFHQPSGHS